MGCLYKRREPAHNLMGKNDGVYRNYFNYQDDCNNDDRHFDHHWNNSDTFDTHDDDGDGKVCLTLAEVMVAGKAVIPGWGKNSIINTTITLSTTTMITTPTYTTMVIPSPTAANNVDITANTCQKFRNCQKFVTYCCQHWWHPCLHLGKAASQSHNGIGGRQPDRSDYDITGQYDIMTLWHYWTVWLQASNLSWPEPESTSTVSADKGRKRREEGDHLNFAIYLFHILFTFFI